MGVPRFEPFPALRYHTPLAADSADLPDLIAPPYDVLSDADTDALAARHPHNIVHIDVPRETDGPHRYEKSAAVMREWIDQGVLVADPEPSFTIYRMRFTDATGASRDISGVLGGLEVVDLGAGGVLPHERTTPKATTDRLDLTRATDANLSPIWGLSLARGLTAALAAPGELMGSVTVDGVEHRVERVSDPERVAQIRSIIGSDDVLIADGHHRYAISRSYRDEVRARGATHTAAEETLTFVNELVADQLSVEAIHRVYRQIPLSELRDRLGAAFDITPASDPSADTLREMTERGALYLWSRQADGLLAGEWLTPRVDAFDGVRALDGAYLEHALEGATLDVTYQHGLQEATDLARDPEVTAVVLIRPVSVAEIERTAREGVLMPPKSTFFTPKLRTGFVIRPLGTPPA